MNPQPQTAEPRIKTQAVERLKKQHSTLSAELARHVTMADESRLKEAEIVASVDLSNPAQFRELSDLRLRRELLPSKIRSFEESIEAVKVELDSACRELASSMNRLCTEKTTTVTGEVSAAIQPFVANLGRNRKSEVDAIVEALSRISPTGSQLQEISFLCTNTCSVGMDDPVERADELIAAAEILERL